MMLVHKGGFVGGVTSDAKVASNEVIASESVASTASTSSPMAA